MSTTLQTLSADIAAILEATGPSVVRVEAGGQVVSGLAWDAETIVTVRHGIDDDSPISVLTADGTTHTAELLGHDPRLDLTFLQVPGAGLPERPAAASTPPAPGHIVLTVGRGPRGLRSSLGIVGAVGPAWNTRGGATVSADLDIDATLHPTAAGGPLLNAAGELLGINTPQLRPGGATVPLDTIDAALVHIRAHGSVRPGLLGVRVRTVPLPPDIAATHGQHQGLLILGTPRRSPAARAGVETGDVLLTVGGKPVGNLRDLRTNLSTAGGSEVSVVLLRAGEVRTVSITVVAFDGFMGGRGRRGGGWFGGRPGGPWRRFRKHAKHHPHRC